MISRLLATGAAACLLAGIAAGSASAAAGGAGVTGGTIAAPGSASAASSIWRVVPSVNPQPHQVTDSSFASVSMASATDGWAVGLFMDKNALENPLAEHWNGSRFGRITVPEPSGRQAELAGVDQLSSTNAWAVGNTAIGVAGEGNIDNQPLIEHWNGSTWSIVQGASLPTGATGTLNAIGGTGPGDLWAAGFTLSADQTAEHVFFEHFDGTTWQPAAFPTQTAACDPGRADCFLDPRAVSATSPDDVWVVGTILEPNPTGNFVAHWDGTAWSVVPAPCLTGTKVTACSGASVDLNELAGAAAISGTDAWAAGSEGNVNNTNFHIPYVEHWNGTAWSLIKTPNPNQNGEGSLLNGITALSPDDIWAVGQTQQLNGAIRPLTEHFNGTTWSLVPAPAPGPTPPDDSLSAAASPGAGLVFAVGARDIAGQCCLRTLVLKTTAG